MNWLPAFLALAVAASPESADSPSPAEADAAESLLRASQVAFRAVAERVRPFLVRIETVGGAQPQGFLPTSEDDSEDEGKPPVPKPFQEDLGSRFVVADGPTTGLIYSSDGYIVTSGFNFVRDPLLISVILSDGRRFAAELVARDQVRKIALLKIEAENLPMATWCDLSDIRVGQWAVALGLGFGGETPSVTVGIVSASNRMLGNAIQTDAKLSPANYGGPVCDLDGRILGISVPMAQRPGELAGIEMYDSGVGFAVPKQRVDDIVSVLKTGRSFYRGWLGIQVDAASTEGLLIRNVADPSPMQAAGIRPGDKILEANGKPIKHFGHLVQSLYMVPAGEKVYLTMQRESRQFGIAVPLARNTELGPLPTQEEPFDPSKPPVLPPDDD